ncbi:tetratricopeptide repeat protein [Sphingomonas naphthae]|uniref:Tetratricopeptide repeat protein n=1 Tax=Sphingomonas naphthae TaxID=1813468 RepID=A0ABY7TI20_9SPHN|nr:tetratricopeptide repeat protein [Sphingomonas naphthae]WCT72830.1 tetratricopeptide repeat protein [Sphingomonas naphthae]
MALTPQSSEAFVREVDDELRRDQMANLWQRHGRTLIAAVVLFLAVVAGAIWWKSHRSAEAGESAEALSVALQDLSTLSATPEAQKAAKEAEAKKKFAALADASPAYSAAAAVAQAALLSQEGKDKEAAIAFRKVAADGKAPQPYRDIATIRAAALDFDRTPPADIIALVKPLAVPGGAWFGSAAEITALAQIKANQTKPAIATIRAIQKDATVPQSIRDRTARLAQSIDPDFVATPATVTLTPKP